MRAARRGKEAWAGQRSWWLSPEAPPGKSRRGLALADLQTRPWGPSWLQAPVLSPMLRKASPSSGVIFLFHPAPLGEGTHTDEAMNCGSLGQPGKAEQDVPCTRQHPSDTYSTDGSLGFLQDSSQVRTCTVHSRVCQALLGRWVNRAGAVKVETCLSDGWALRARERSRCLCPVGAAINQLTDCIRVALDGHGSRRGKVDLSEAVVRRLQTLGTQDVAQWFVTWPPCLNSTRENQNKSTFLGWGGLLLFLLLRGRRNHVLPHFIHPHFLLPPLLSLLPSFSSFFPSPRLPPIRTIPETPPFPSSSSSAPSLLPSPSIGFPSELGIQPQRTQVLWL